MHRPSDMALDMIMLIDLHSTPNRENQVFLKKIANVNKELSRECRTLFQTPSWLAWQMAQIEMDVEIEIPAVISRGDNAACLKLLNFYSDDLHTQALMVSKMYGILKNQQGKSQSAVHRMPQIFHLDSDCDSPHAVPSSITQVACRIMSLVRVPDFIHSTVYYSVFDIVVEWYFIKRKSAAWRIMYIDVFSNIICQFSTHSMLVKMSSGNETYSVMETSINWLHYQLYHDFDESSTKLSSSYEAELLSAFCTLFPKINTTLCVFLCSREYDRNIWLTERVQRVYIDLLEQLTTSIDRLHTTITLVIPDICMCLDSLVQAAKQNRLDRYWYKDDRDAHTIDNERKLFRKLYEFRMQHNLALN